MRNATSVTHPPALFKLSGSETGEIDRQRVAQADQRIAAARARVERMGGALHVVAGGGGRPSFLACRWTLTRELADIEAVEHWLTQLEARA